MDKAGGPLISPAMRMLLLAPLLALAACSQPLEGRITERLTEAGLAEPMARCMAERWVKRLNPLQLREIASVADDLKAQGGQLNVGGLIARVRQVEDPEIVEVVSSSTVVCALTA